MKRRKINERFQFFSIVLNVRGGENVDWKKLTQDGIVNKMIELKFPNLQHFSFHNNFVE